MINLGSPKSKCVVCSHEVASVTGRSLVQKNPGECMCERERSLYKPGLHKTVARELAKYGLDLVLLCEVRCGKESGEQAEDCTFFLEQT